MLAGSLNICRGLAVSSDMALPAFTVKLVFAPVAAMDRPLIYPARYWAGIVSTAGTVMVTIALPDRLIAALLLVLWIVKTLVNVGPVELYESWATSQLAP